MGKSVSQDLNIDVRSNAPIAIGELCHISISQGTALNWLLPAGSFIDPDKDDKLTYSATLKNGDPLPCWLTIDKNTGTLTGTPTSLEKYEIIITATDLSGNTVSHDLALEVNTFDNIVDESSSSKNNNLTGTAGHDSISGGTGNDIIVDTKGKNYLNGGEGDDKITGTGTLVGGRGNDLLTANIAGSSDTFIFNKGDGKDIISSLDTAKVKGQDVIEFGDEIIKDDVTFQRSGNNLIIKVGTNDDQITINNYFSGDNYSTINEIKFSDGSSLNIKENMFLTGSCGNDRITGSQWNDRIFGDYGNDIIVDTKGRNYLDGGEGDDNITGTGTLVGGKGDDVLTANVADSADTFIFNIGDGQDTIVSVDTAANKGDDVIQFGADITTDMVSWTQKGKNLLLTVDSGTSCDQMTINNYFAGNKFNTIAH